MLYAVAPSEDTAATFIMGHVSVLVVGLYLNVPQIFKSCVVSSFSLTKTIG